MMATGGVYLGGGIAPKIVSKLKEPAFMNAFMAKGRLSPLLRDIPVRVITNPKTALAPHGMPRSGLRAGAHSRVSTFKGQRPTGWRLPLPRRGNRDKSVSGHPGIRRSVKAFHGTFNNGSGPGNVDSVIPNEGDDAVLPGQTRDQAPGLR